MNSQMNHRKQAESGGGKEVKSMTEIFPTTGIDVSKSTLVLHEMQLFTFDEGRIFNWS